MKAVLKFKENLKRHAIGTSVVFEAMRMLPMFIAYRLISRA